MNVHHNTNALHWSPERLLRNPGRDVPRSAYAVSKPTICFLPSWLFNDDEYEMTDCDRRLADLAINRTTRGAITYRTNRLALLAYSFVRTVDYGDRSN